MTHGNKSLRFLFDSHSGDKTIYPIIPILDVIASFPVCKISWFPNDLRSQSLVSCLLPHLPHFIPACWLSQALFQSPRKLELAASCWQGVRSSLLECTLPKGESKKGGEWIIHRDGLQFCHLPHRGRRNGLCMVVGGL